MDRTIEDKLGIITIRQVFPISGIYVIAYQNGKKLYERFES